jgi:hypothetical protein
MKSTILLTAALFLVCAPSLDSKTVSEMSGGFLKENSETGLMASETSPGAKPALAAFVPVNEPDIKFGLPVAEQR